MLKDIKHIILFIFTLSVLIITVLNKINDKRYLYEKFLVEKFTSIQSYTKKDLENIPKPEHPDLATYQNYFIIQFSPMNHLQHCMMV